MADQPSITHIRDAEIRLFDAAPGTDDASDMYVMEVLGATVNVRRVRDSATRDHLLVCIETEGEGAFAISINNDENWYGQAGDPYDPEENPS
jgi:hypothetical protein